MAPAGTVTSIRSGTYLGECLTYCNEEISLTAEAVTYSLTSPVPDADHPNIHAEDRTEPSDWGDVAGLVDWDAFRSLPRVIGHPDASDAGGEFVELSDGRDTRRIDFDLGATVSQIAPLLDRLRDRRAGLARQHRP